ncbi:MAG TPA: hypothetical protein PKV16_05725 [Caldisericia bacterium]|nr:hypothetical protein [Caldisericia bacterium]HPF49313.1 hypothetical protein [Caldisericia bacterium]HPI84007.1 hypothetical protein [Caldisericia bacterium]HPQ93265.1 hypothetical protein [Caldisericia bacterium]HRV75353.1 hypothetical protein [Caldisericia bacterium]
MGDVITIVQLAFECLIGLVVLGCAIFLFLHARRGEDIATLPFATSCLSLFVVIAAMVFVTSQTGVSAYPSKYTLDYLMWFVLGGYLLFSIGIFWSVFFRGKLTSVVVIPFVAAVTIYLLVGFVPGFMSWLPEFELYGSWVWLLAGVLMLSTSLNFLLLHVRENQRYRFNMFLALLLLSIVMFLHMFVSYGSVLWYVSHLLRLVSFGILFYEFQIHYSHL